MDFFKKLFKWDANATSMEKGLTVLFAVVVVFCFLWLFTSAIGLWNNEISQAAHATSGGMKVIGWLLFLGCIFWAWWNWSDSIPFKVNDTVAALILFVAFALSILFLTGFYEGVY